MSLSDLASLGSFVSGIAVLASLVFLFFQMRQMTEQVKQAERNQQSAVRQGRANALIGANLALVDPRLASGFYETAFGGNRMTTEGAMSASAVFMAAFQQWEDDYDQHCDGLLSERSFESFIRNLRGVLVMPGFRVAWRRRREMFGEEFALFIDNMIAELPVATINNNPFEAMLTEIRAERTRAVAD